MCVRIWLEVGHLCEPRRTASGRALDWRVWVRGSRGSDISPFVHKVVFHLHPPSAFFYPKRVLQEPPYEIQESGCESIDIPIHVYLKSSKPKKIRLRYSLLIENNNKTSSESRSVYYDFENPPEPLFTALMKGGGEIICRSNWKKRSNNLFVLFEGNDKPKDYTMKTKRYKYIEPVKCEHSISRTETYVLEDICPKCGDSINTDFKRQLRSVAMTEEEIERVSHLYLTLSRYEKSVNALTLPPFNDPIYTVPELPRYLKRSY